MPYIKHDRRKYIDLGINDAFEFIKDKGDLTYAIYKLCVNYMKSKPINYTNLSTTMSCLEDAKLEWYRRKVASYENQKILENGDVE